MGTVGLIAVVWISLANMQPDPPAETVEARTESSSSEDVPDIFRRFDTNGDGRLTPTEFRHLFVSLRLDSSAVFTRELFLKIDRRFQTFDRDNDGRLNLREGRAAMERLSARGE